MTKNPRLDDAAAGATHQTYEIRTVADFLKVPEARRRICLREFHSWLDIQASITNLLCVASETINGADDALKPENIRWQNQAFNWNDDGKATISVQMVELPPTPDLFSGTTGPQP